MSLISQFVNNLHSWIYCSCTFHILFHSEPKITLFYLLSFALIRCTTRCYLLSFVITRCITRCHSSFVVTRCHLLSLIITGCHSLSLVGPLVVIPCTTRCHSLALVVPLVVTRCTTRVSFYKRSFLLRSINITILNFLEKISIDILIHSAHLPACCHA